MGRRGRALLRALGLGLAVIAVSPVNPVVLVGLPLAVQLLAFRREEGLALALAAVLVLFLFADFGRASDAVWYAERGWALLLGGGFVAATTVWSERPLVARGIAALAVAGAGVALIGLLRPGLLAEVDWWISRDVDRAAGLAREWITALGAASESEAARFEEVLRRASRWHRLLYPGFLALGSLAALGVGWFVVARLGGGAEALGPLREFRFSDHLAWVLIAGLVLVLPPAGEIGARLGGSALLFMMGLYLLRGVAVLVWLGAASVTSAWSVLLWGALAVVLYPVALVVALFVGLGDTWLDIRARGT